jgi:hypothetical protein
VPSDKTKWREVSLDAPKAANVRFKITLTRRGGANFYLDAVRVSSSGALGVSDELARAINFNVAPNPFSNTTELSYELANSSEITISVVDILGRNLGTIASGKMNAGNHSVNLDRNTLGTYVSMKEFDASLKKLNLNMKDDRIAIARQKALGKNKQASASMLNFLVQTGGELYSEDELADIIEDYFNNTLKNRNNE